MKRTYLSHAIAPMFAAMIAVAEPNPTGMSGIDHDDDQADDDGTANGS